MNYLLIQNAGVAPVEGYTLLGMSTTRNCGVDGAIGQFGSGAKHAINVLLRAGLKFWIYCGKTRLHFYTKTKMIDDGLAQKTVNKVMCRATGTCNKTIDCGWVLDFGAIDWDRTAMALREFVSNAIDRTIRQEKDFIESIKSGDLAVIPKTGEQRRAKGGYTRIYIEMGPEVQRFYSELPKRFLHFSIDPSQVHKGMLPKTDRNLGNGSTPMIYRCGVLVREIKDSTKTSLFDFNFKTNELSIDECRNSSEYATRGACAKLMRGADKETLATIFKSLTDGEETFESEADSYYLCGPYDEPSDKEKQTWQEGWTRTNGDAIMCNEEATGAIEYVRRKGHIVQPIKSSGWTAVAQRMGIKTADNILSDSEQKGRETVPASPEAIRAVETVWAWLEALGMTQGKEMPEVACYRDIMSAESEVHGYYKDGVVYLREDITGSVNKYTLKVAYEEVVHYVTGATDASRDMQNFLIDMFVEVAA